MEIADCLPFAVFIEYIRLKIISVCARHVLLFTIGSNLGDLNPGFSHEEATRQQQKGDRFLVINDLILSAFHGIIGV
jgi:hypothetical protein